jgi:threonine dehydrogenase-like Zn-dependent dehydrogenase
MGQTHMHKYMKPLLERIMKNEIDPRFIISHEVPLESAADAYKMFAEKQDACTKFVLHPKGLSSAVVRGQAAQLNIK